MSAEQRRRLREAERKVGELTLDNDILRAAVRKRGARDPAGEAAAVSAELAAPLVRVCRVLRAPRSTARPAPRRHRCSARPGGTVGDAELVTLIRQVLTDSPFAGEHYRQVRARRPRVRQAGAAAAAPRGAAGAAALRPAAGEAGPRRLDRAGAAQPALGTDATMCWTVDDGWVWLFDLIDHHTADASARVVAKVGDRFAVLQPVYDAVLDRFGAVPTSPAASRSATTAAPVPQCVLHRLAGLARPDRVTGLCRRAGVQRGENQRSRSWSS